MPSPAPGSMPRRHFAAAATGIGKQASLMSSPRGRYGAASPSDATAAQLRAADVSARSPSNNALAAAAKQAGYYI